MNTLSVSFSPFAVIGTEMLAVFFAPAAFIFLSRWILAESPRAFSVSLSFNLNVRPIALPAAEISFLSIIGVPFTRSFASGSLEALFAARDNSLPTGTIPARVELV